MADGGELGSWAVYLRLERNLACNLMRRTHMRMRRSKIKLKRAMAAATFRFMQATAKTAMRRVLGIRGGQGETLVPPTAVAGGDEGFVFEFEASDNNNSG